MKRHILAYILLFALTVNGEQLQFTRLPSYFRYSGSEQSSGVSVSNILKTMLGMPASGQIDTPEITRSGLKVPKVIVFLQITGEFATNDKTPLIFIKEQNPFSVSQTFEDIQKFFGDSAHILQMTSDAADPSHVLYEAISVISKTAQFSQTGPLILSTTPFKWSPKVNAILKNFISECFAICGDDFAIFSHINPATVSTRSRRETRPREMLSTKADQSDKEKYNLGEDYSDSYPVIFNIILWFMIAMVLAIASVSYCIWFMDPGKDGIIYRMTASRVKKDL